MIDQHSAHQLRCNAEKYRGCEIPVSAFDHATVRLHEPLLAARCRAARRRQ
jgi:hypothetical protein